MKNDTQSIDSKYKIAATAAIELDLSDAFNLFTDTAKLEQRARSAGADVIRTSGQGIESGSAWEIRATLRKKERVIALSVLDSRRLEYVLTRFHSQMFEGRAQLKFSSKSQGLTQVRLDLRLAPKTLSARVVLQGLRLTRHRQKRRLNGALQRLCRHFEAQHRAKG